MNVLARLLKPVGDLDRAIQARFQTIYQDLLDRHDIYVGTVRAAFAFAFFAGGVVIAAIGEIRDHGVLEPWLLGVMLVVISPIVWLHVYKPHLLDEWNWQHKGNYAALATGSLRYLQIGWTARVFVSTIMAVVGVSLSRGQINFTTGIGLYLILTFCCWTYACGIVVNPRTPRTVENRSLKLSPSQA